MEKNIGRKDKNIRLGAGALLLILSFLCTVGYKRLLA